LDLSQPGQGKILPGTRRIIAGGHIKVEVFDPSGRRVFLKEFSNIKSNPEIATGNLNGLYLVRVSAGERVYQERVLLKK